MKYQKKKKRVRETGRADLSSVSLNFWTMHHEIKINDDIIRYAKKSYKNIKNFNTI